jgi:hypothetical protein
MGFRDKIKTMKKDLVHTTQESIDRGDDAPEYGSIFIKDNIPAGVGFWRPDTGEHLIDLIPFQSAGDDPRTEKGRWTYLIDVQVHQNVGAMFDDFVCQLRAWKEIDPICQYTKVADLTTPQWSKLAPKRRTAYLIWCHDSPEEEEKGIQIWEVAHWNFEKHLSKISKHPKGGAPIPFSHVIDGKSIAFEIVKSGTYTDGSGKERDSKDFLGHRFVERDEEVPDEFGDKIFALDACIKFKLTWEEQEKAFPLSKQEAISAAPTKDAQSDDKPIDDENEEKKPSTSEAEDTQSESSTSELECPGGGTIGVDLEKLDACGKCGIWDDCSDAADKLKKTAKTSKKEEPAEKPTEKKKILRRRRRLSK